MALGSDGISLLFKAVGKTEDAQKAFSDLRTSITNDVKGVQTAGTSSFSSLAQSAGLSAGAMAGLATGIGAIATVMAAEIAIAVRVTTGLFSLAQSASEAGSKLKDMQDKTGLAASTLSTLKLAADNSGSSFEAVGGGIAKFAKLLGEAAAGSSKAQDSLKALNVDTTNLDTGLKEVIRSIASAQDGTEQITLAQKAFGKAGADLIPVIKQMAGDLEAAEKEAARLGTTLSEQDIQAADAFGDAWGVLTAQIEAGAAKFALSYAPQITDAIEKISEFLANNQDTWKIWGEAVSQTMTGISVTVSALGTAFDIATGGMLRFMDNSTKIKVAADAAIFSLNPLLGVLQKIGEAYDKAFPKGEVYGPVVNGPGSRPGGNGIDSSKSTLFEEMPYGGTVFDFSKQPKAKADDSKRQEEERLRKEEERRRKAVQAAMQEMQDKLAILQKGYERRRAILDGETRTEESHAAEMHQIHYESLIDEQALLNKLLENKEFNTEERKKIEQQLKLIEEDLTIEAIKRSNDLNDAEEKDHKNWLRRNKEREDFLADMASFRELVPKVTDDSYIGTGGTAASDPYNFGLAESWSKFKDSILADGPAVGEVLANLGQTGWNALNQLAEGLGSVVQNWVLTGGSIGKAMKQMVASVLAGVAAQSAVLAIFELAKGFAALFWNPAEAAAHFTAAALFGSIAVGTALVGRAVAGNSFQRESSGAYGSAGSGQGSGSQGGSQYSSQPGQVIDTSRNAPGLLGRIGLDLNLGLSKDGLIECLRDNVNNNGQIRLIIREAAAS